MEAESLEAQLLMQSNDSFGSFSDFKEKFSSTSAVIQGSGWGWLVFNPSTGKVEYKAMPNQTSPRTEGLVPLLGCRCLGACILSKISKQETRLYFRLGGML